MIHQLSFSPFTQQSLRLCSKCNIRFAHLLRETRQLCPNGPLIASNDPIPAVKIAGSSVEEAEVFPNMPDAVPDACLSRETKDLKDSFAPIPDTETSDPALVLEPPAPVVDDDEYSPLCETLESEFGAFLLDAVDWL